MTIRLKKIPRQSISRIAAMVLIAAIVVVAAAAAGFLYTSSSPHSSTSSTSTSSSTFSSMSSASIPSSLTWETPNTVDYLDPHVSYTSFGYSILQNVYEPLLWYNGSCSSCVIPWLAQNYTASADLSTYNFTLRSGIAFQDGEPLNSTAVYFSLNRLLIEDGSTPVSLGTQASFILQQLLNTSLSTTLCGCTQTYDASYVKDVLAQNFVRVTGPLTFTIHVQHPSFAFPYMLGDIGSDIVAPAYVIRNDIAMWNQSGYILPYPTPTGNYSSQIEEYFIDEASTCNTGVTPQGCGTTYLDGSYQGAQAGTGPYEIKSFDSSSNDIVLQANPRYWGGPNKVEASNPVPAISTIYINYVPEQSTRLLDLQSAATSGRAMTVDVEPDHLYDVASRSGWLENKTLSSIIPGVTLYGPYKSFYTYFDAFSMNVSDAQTGEFYQFQPFADLRFRLAFADSVNMSEINQQVNNELGQVAFNVVPPGLPPEGASNSSIRPIYSYNATAVQELLLDAMFHPIRNFSFVNGTAAPSGVFNNTFGCLELDSKGACANPVHQSITLTYYTGDSVDQTIFNQIAGVINNVSATYNMGLTVSVMPVPFGYMSTLGFSDRLYMYMIGGWGDDYPWVMDFLGPMYAPGQIYPLSDGWNITRMGDLYDQASRASESGNISALIQASNAMNELANQQVMYLWTFNPYAFSAITSNVHGFYFNPSLAQMPTGYYFAALH